MHVKAVRNRVILEVSNESCDINGGHCYSG